MDPIKGLPGALAGAAWGGLGEIFFWLTMVWHKNEKVQDIFGRYLEGFLFGSCDVSFLQLHVATPHYK